MHQKSIPVETAENTNDLSSIFRPKSSSEVLFNTCTKFYPDGDGGWYPVKRITFDRLIYNPQKMEQIRTSAGADICLSEDEAEGITNSRNEGTFWKKSYNRARQQCYDYLMCNPDLDTFVTFTVDPQEVDSFSYCDVVKKLSVWLSNRVRRNDLKYILVPERHESGAIHFHGIMNQDGLRLISSGYWKVGKYTLTYDRIAKSKKAQAQEILNVEDLTLGFSTAILIVGEDCQTKISKYIWKYMTKQAGQKIGGRFYLHGGDLCTPKLVFSNEYFTEAEGALVTYAGTTCKILDFNS